MAENWLYQGGKITINIPEIDRLAIAMNKIADELEKFNKNNGKHSKGKIEQTEQY